MIEQCGHVTEMSRLENVSRKNPAFVPLIFQCHRQFRRLLVHILAMEFIITTKSIINSWPSSLRCHTDWIYLVSIH
jgi:hypothetical protein